MIPKQGGYLMLIRMDVTVLLLIVSSIVAANGEDCLAFECPSRREDPAITVFAEGGGNQTRNLTEGETLRKEKLILTCRASYPIVWEFTGNHQLPSFYVTGNRDVDNVLNPTKQCFESTLNVHPSQQQSDSNTTSRTGRYICKSVNLVWRSREASSYVFAFDRQEIFNSKKAANVEVKSTKSNGVYEALIPCPANVANLNVSLFQIDENGIPTAVPESISVDEYNPQTGFLLRTTSKKNLTSKYACIGSYQGLNDTVEVTVIRKLKKFTVSPEQNYVTFQKNAFNVECNSSQPFDIAFRNHSEPLRFDAIATASWKKVNVYRDEGKVANGTVTCQRRSTEKVLWTWHYNSDYGCDCNITADNKLNCSSPATGSVNLTYIPCNNPIECMLKSMSSNEYEEFLHAEAQGGNITVVDLPRRSSLLKCIAGNYTSFNTIIIGFNNFTDSDVAYIDEIPSEAPLIHVVGTENNVFVGDKVLFTCTHSTFNLLTGSERWAFAYSNGTVLVTDAQKAGSNSRVIQYSGSYYIKIPSADVTEVICFVPEWTTPEWRNASLALKIHSAPVADTGCSFGYSTDSGPAVIMERKSHLDGETVPHLVTNDTLVLPISRNISTEFKLICHADYPVQWMKNGEVLESQLVLIPCGENKSDPVYEAVLRMSVEKNYTGNYECTDISGEAPEVLANVFFFMSGEKSPSFINQGHHIEVVKIVSDLDSDPWVTLPCEVDSLEAIPYLFQFLDLGESGNLQRLELGNSLRFDPKVGFQLDMSTVQDATTNYICSWKEDGCNFGVFVSLQKQNAEVQ